MDLLLDRLKKVGEILKAAVLYVLLPIGVIGSYIAYALSRRADSKAKEKQTKVEKELANVLEKKETAARTSSDAVAEYERLREKLFRGGQDDV